MADGQSSQQLSDALYFFVHIMKAAGTTFREEFGALFPPTRVWPPMLATTDPGRASGADPTMMYSSVAPLGEMVAARQPVSFVAGHFPFAARELLQRLARNDGSRSSRPLFTMMLLREPVDRTISFLAYTRRHTPALHDQPLESIYEDRWLFDRFIGNHQTRVLSMTLPEARALRTDQLLLRAVLRAMAAASALDDGARAAVDRLLDDDPAGRQRASTLLDDLERLGVDVSTRDEQERRVRSDPRYHVTEAGLRYLYVDAALARPSPLDRERFETAALNLERCDVLGTTEDYAGFVHDVNLTFGLACGSGARRNVGASSASEVSDAFRRRIEADNRLDVELYSRAVSLIADRRRARVDQYFSI